MPENPSYYRPAPAFSETHDITCDFCAYGSTPAGISSAVQASRYGLKAVIVDPSRKVGGMTASGIGWTDTGKSEAIGGYALEFYREIGKYYGEGTPRYKFEPHVAEKTFLRHLKENGVEVFHGQFLKEVTRDGSRITEILTESGLRVRAKVFADCSYEGDLLAMSGVSFTTGREDNEQYGETLNGFQLRDKHQFNFPVSPYVREGDPSSGLLPGIEGSPIPETGTGDSCLQAYNFRVCMTNNPELRIPFPKPEGYNRDDYVLLERYLKAGWDLEPRKVGTFAKYDFVTQDKTDTNNHGAFSSDYIGANHDYPLADCHTREKIYQDHVTFHQGYLWFLQNDPCVPPKVAAEIKKWGLAADEFQDSGHWPPQMYVREARRMLSSVVMTEHHCKSEETVEDSIGMGSYNIDSHNCRRVVVDGLVKNEGDVQVRLPRPYRISYRIIVPKKQECTNLFVPVCVSATHIAYGSIRMEPVFLILGQSAAAAAKLALDENLALQDVPYAKLRSLLHEQKQLLEPSGDETSAR